MPDYLPTDILCQAFVISSKVTPETLYRLNDAFPKDSDWPQEFKNYFNPVPRDLSQLPVPSKDPVDFVIEIVGGGDTKALMNISRDVYKQAVKDGYETSAAFVILDDRSVEDDTLLVYFLDYDIDEDDEDAEPKAHWRHWRVRFSDAYEMVRIFDTCEFVAIEGYILDVAEQYTGDDGIFEFGEAAKSHAGGVLGDEEEEVEEEDDEEKCD
ncbi:hypothetical protein AMS68_001141 [Peltaster fructicola]|uniref:Uncharacterized protein n=1 Tax=Peltaster fructicola TaxID=286661 RepID=A0A6H0XLM4_9PEZI|nr:hypothetical protein AMS68_001141 [Peltaster fructicola]